MSAKWLAQLKGEGLKRLCVNVGLRSTGVKHELADSLVSAATLSHDLDPSVRVLSIDMGVRNLACCEIEAPLRAPGILPTQLQLPTVNRWTVRTLQDESESGAPLYDQPMFAKAAVDLVESLGLENIDVVLIERQRLQTKGFGNVPEWISRVNLLDAMLHALIQAKRANGSVHCEAFSINPITVKNYWFPRLKPLEDAAVDGPQPQPPRAKYSHHSSYRRGKLDKVGLVSLWFENSSSPFTVHDDIGPHPWHSGSKKIRKTDDYADSLLQGLGWINWQRNLGLISAAIQAEDLDLLSTLASSPIPSDSDPTAPI